ncbi:MAG: BlaI/MecI/CopY family transcriptional regulator [Verrucomicrobiota bacterium]|jgi:BlaI family penicillinase repressor
MSARSNPDPAGRKVPRISQTEWEVMKAAWAQGPCSAAHITAVLNCADPSWHPKTVRTFLGRLVKKRALTFTKQGRAYLYRPLVRQDECADAASELFLRRVFGGSAKSMLAHLITRNKLSVGDIRELRGLLGGQG